ncbi:pyridoxamine 5'-phosphate oxidase [Olivibacter sp. SDN3]|uniref:pyridoxamine 5'-phosphate oxidase n=1 Tax=Olivibacter sp. SDN3 TaxID=2764720 RepID=UPI001650E378|nr:pyridoxamine 5'-phosphate oxidase [Olivibacter sp. SDN3]QNL48568.1 pyridoxamine 5'-phosphate oxidase [Olivibacter sp. SDN3]
MHKETTINAIRTDYKRSKLTENEVKKNPIEQFKFWFEQAIKACVIEVNAMTLATVDREGSPSARIVLLKGVEDNGFVFFTNYNSQKGQDLIVNNKASLVFFWPDLERQVRIKGFVDKTSSEVSDSYFHSRPIGSQLGAWASPQSTIIADRAVLESNLERITQKYKSTSVPRPPHWGGYIVQPITVEFWQGRPNRLHDRILYTKKSNYWLIERLAP